MLIKKLALITSILLVIAFASTWVCVHIGSEKIPFGEINKIIIAKLTGKHLLESPIETIVWDLRLPRILVAAFVGASLALAGSAFQGILRNPLADPYIVGTSAGAAVGGVFAIVFNIRGSLLGISAIAVLAFVGAILAMYIVYRISVVGGRVPVETFLLAGVVVGSFLWAMVSFLLTLAKQNMQEVIFWLMGSTGSAGWSEVTMLFIYFIIGFTGLMYLSHSLNILTLGDESAMHLGVEVERIRNLIIIFASLVTAASVAAAGLIGFVGLMIPHVIRRVVGADHRILIPTSALAGAIYLMWVDTAARSILSPREIPVGVLTAIMGAPFFLYLLRNRKRKKEM
ncbi:MAG: iron chelate uptake ABC transporter family permease subunit [Candidatus Eremiobacteraeota bacterium]|nr:iron chelate uptake ABC transporter family permease subunit [Candidatus Eremiobacteraeota bacterium]